MRSYNIIIFFIQEVGRGQHPFFFFLREGVQSPIRYRTNTRLSYLSEREHILTTLTLHRRTNATHLVTVNVNDLGDRHGPIIGAIQKRAIIAG